jgi:mannose-1-phosphate guanylyltransferase
MKKLVLILLLMSMKSYAQPTFYGVVLAGGVGERLWPLSRQHKPKQFLRVAGHKTLLEQSIDRLAPIVDHTWIVTSQKHADLVHEYVGDMVDHVMVEPEGRNTAPAILYTCLQLYKKDPQAVVLFVPADPFIPESDYEKFQNLILKAGVFAQEYNDIVLLGIQPTYPATGYGYIQYDQQSTFSPFFKITQFHEKPSLKLAQNYIKQSNMLWNIGMFCGKVSVFIEQYKRWVPELYHQVVEFMKGTRPYHQVESISIDYAVMERSDNVYVLPADFSWCDVGNVDVFMSLHDKFNVINRKVIQVDAKDNLVNVPNKLVALIGVDDLCVVETDDALLITKRSQAERVREIVKELKAKNQTEYL